MKARMRPAAGYRARRAARRRPQSEVHRKAQVKEGPRGRRRRRAPLPHNLVTRSPAGVGASVGARFLHRARQAVHPPSPAPLVTAITTPKLSGPAIMG